MYFDESQVLIFICIVDLFKIWKFACRRNCLFVVSFEFFISIRSLSLLIFSNYKLLHRFKQYFIQSYF